MPTFRYTVEITAKNQEQASEVIVNRVSGGADYGFDYTITILDTDN